MSTANHYRPEPSPRDSGSVAPSGASGGSMGPETQMLNLKILQNLAQNNIYRDERSKEGVRALEKSLLGESDRYTPSRAAELAGIPLKAARRIWRNMGFPDIAPNVPYFTEADVRMLADLRALDDEGTIRMEYVVSLVRAEGQLTDRTVAWQIEALVHNIMVTENVDDNEARRKLLLDFPRYLEVLEHLAVYAYRRQMYAGILRLGLRENNATSSGIAHLPLVRGVGFVDLVSYTWMRRPSRSSLTTLSRAAWTSSHPWVGASLRPSAMRCSSSPKPRMLLLRLACNSLKRLVQTRICRMCASPSSGVRCWPTVAMCTAPA